MKKKRSNSTRGGGTRGSRAHSKDLSDDQKKDAENLKKFSKTKPTKIVRILLPGQEERAAFPSDFKALRRDVRDNFGYRIPRKVMGSDGKDVALPEHRGKSPKKKRPGAPQKLSEAYRILVPGEPDIDGGVSAWVKPVNTDDFEILGNRMDSLLQTFNRLERAKWKVIVDGKELEVAYNKLKTRKAEASKLEDQGSGEVTRVKGHAESVTLRDTLIASPYISRAIQRMIEDGLVDEARQAVEAAMEPLGREYEATFRGEMSSAKLTSMLPHVGSGHFHYDCWVHSTYRAEAEIGIRGEITPVRFWDARATCHHGPGPGVTFWTRHLDVLGDLDELAKTEPEAAERAGYTKMLCDQAVAGCRERAEDAHKKALEEKAKVEADGGTYDKWIRPAHDFARDIRITRAMDRILTKAIGDLGLGKDYVEIGRAEYREHLIEAYKSGNTGIRMNTPEDLEQVCKVAARAEERARKEREAAETALAAVRLEKVELERLRDEVSALREPTTNTTEEIVVEIQNEIKKVRTATLAEAELLGVQAAFTAVLPGKEPVAKTAAEIVVEIQQGIQEGQSVAMAEAKLGGVKAAYAAILPGREPTTETVGQIVAEIQTGIREVRTAALAEAEREGVIAAYRAVLPGREPVDGKAAEIVLAIQAGIEEVKTAAMGEIVEKQADLDLREKKLGELTLKANLWDRAEGVIKRVFDLFSAPEQQKIKEYASGDSSKLPTAKVTSWKQAFSRLAVLAGIVKGKEPDI